MNDDSDYEDVSEKAEKKESVVDEAIFIQKEVTECFSVFDQKGRGLMPSKLLDRALKSLGILLTPTEINEVLNKFEKEGFVELSDFMAYASEKLTEIEPYYILKSAFNVFDPDNEGMFPTDRFKKWMTTLGDPLTESEAKELCKMGDPANKGFFSYDDVIPRLLY